MDPFLEVEEFVSMFRPLTEAETVLADPLLKVASNWIWERKPDIEVWDPAARLVVFEVVSDALRYGKYRGLESFQDTTGDRTKAGTFAAAAGALTFTDRHRQLLGISASAKAAAHFKVCDY